MANYSCDLTTLLRNSKCFREPCLSEDEREAIDIVLRVTALKAVGGADYTGSILSLSKAAKQWQPLAAEQRQSIALFIDLENAIFNGATLSTNVNVLRALAKCYLCIGKEQRRNLLLFLKCALNTLDQPD